MYDPPANNILVFATKGMANLLRGARNLLGGAEDRDSGGRSLVGKPITVGKYSLRIRNKIAQGGFATVYSGQDNEGGWVAVKEQLVHDESTMRAVQEEIKLLKSMTHPHILKYLVAAKEAQLNGVHAFLLVTELCSGGSVIDLITAGPLTIAQVANVMHATCSALTYLHSLSPPITHRDIKVENLLFDGRGVVKLCDFGSATNEELIPEQSWNATQRTKVEEDSQRHTTPMYRAPEILDTYLHYPIGPLQDVWAVGCVLFYMCFRVHPFEDSAKLRIIYAKYKIPEEDTRYESFHPLIKCSLRPDPRDRPSAKDLMQSTEALAVALEVRVDVPVPGVDTTVLSCGEQQIMSNEKKQSARSTVESRGGGIPSSVPSRPSPRGEEFGQQATAAFSSFKGQASSLFRNLKEKGTAVVQTVQNTYGSKGPEMQWVTTRIVMAPQAEGIPEALAVQAEETLRIALFATRRPFKIMNLGHRRLRGEYPVSVIDCQFPSDGPSPSIDSIIGLSQTVGVYLRQNPSESFIVLVGSEFHCSLAAICLLVYHRLFPKTWQAIEYLQERLPSPLMLPPSAHRCIDILHKSTQKDFRQLVHNMDVRLDRLVIDGLPTFNHARTGCRPLVMVYVGGAAISTPQPFDSLALYEGNPGRCALLLRKMIVAGDVCVVVNHARMNSMSGRVQYIPMFSFGLHSSLVDGSSDVICLRKGDIDFSVQDDNLIPQDIKVTLSLILSPSTRPILSSPLFNYPVDIVAPRHVVDSTKELKEIQTKFSSGGRSERSEYMAKGQEREEKKVNEVTEGESNGFFDSLTWNETAAPPPPPPPHREKVPQVTEREHSLKVEESSNQVFIPTETPILGGNSNHSPGVSQLSEEVDLLGLGREGPELTSSSHSSSKGDLLVDPFSTSNSSTATPHLDFFSTQSHTTCKPSSNLDDLFSSSVVPPSESKTSSHPDLDLFGSAPISVSSHSATKDLLGDFLQPSSQSSMHRNASAPSLPPESQKKKEFDPFAEFLSSNPSTAAASSASSTRSNTPHMTRVNYSRSAFDSINPPTNKPKIPVANVFDDLLHSHGFTSSSQSGNRTMADMRREEDIRDLTPEEIKIRDWTKGKERNIRALLASLDEVLWEGCDRWKQPTMGNLLTANEVKKYFRLAAVVVHPDKQTGGPNAELSKAIMIELNDAWNAFEESGSPSLQ